MLPPLKGLLTVRGVRVIFFVRICLHRRWSLEVTPSADGMQLVTQATIS